MLKKIVEDQMIHKNVNQIYLNFGLYLQHMTVKSIKVLACKDGPSKEKSKEVPKAQRTYGKMVCLGNT